MNVRGLPHPLRASGPNGRLRKVRNDNQRTGDPTLSGVLVAWSSGGSWLRITFHGATRQVTGSAHLLEIGPYRLLLDCGPCDSERIDPTSPNHQLPFDPRTLDAVIVSHAHNDHIGRIPCLVKGGYSGPIY